ncbi:hypothetical protein HDU91_000880 [Kappamyces sp. JEL0680]|nr:hypothetical protein HDU91_000880 [Kappamyces sp. JEL0680]
MQVRYAMDLLTLVSHEQLLKFNDCPELLTTMLELFSENIDVATAKQKPASAFTYSQLYEMEFCSINSLQSNCVSSLDRQASRRDLALSIGLVLRNCSCMYENQSIMGLHPLLGKTLLKMLNLAVPPSIQDAIQPGPASPTLSYPCLLEHRKNALLIFSQLGQFLALPDIESTSLVISLCTDFITDDSGVYIYHSLDALARLMLNPRNQGHFEGASGYPALVKGLLKLLPQTGFPLFQTVQQHLAEWELALVVLTSIISNVSPHILVEFLQVPGIMKQLYHLAKRPTSSFRLVSPETLNMIASLRERCVKNLIALVHVESEVEKRQWEKELLMLGLRSGAEGEPWMYNVVFEHLGE